MTTGFSLLGITVADFSWLPFSEKGRREGLPKIRAKTLFIVLGSPSGKVHNGSFNDKLREELLNGEIFYTMKKAKVLIEEWRKPFSTVSHHSSLNYRPPDPQTVMPVFGEAKNQVLTGLVIHYHSKCTYYVEKVTGF